MNLQQSINKIYVECNNCNQRNEYVVQVDLKLTNKILIVKIELDNYGNTNHITSMFSNCKIKSVPTVKVKIHDRLYKVQSDIFFNNTITSEEYSIMVRDNTNGWFLINNENTEDARMHGLGEYDTA